MSYLNEIPSDKEDGLLQKLYDEDQKSKGYVSNYIKVFSSQPDVYAAWQVLISSIRSKMRLRRYELVTLAAAMALKCTYCMLAHGSILRKNFFSAEELISIVNNYHNSALSKEEILLMDFAQKVILEPSSIGENEYDSLRKIGLKDKEILDVVLAATARSFFSKTLDAVGAEPDSVYSDLEPDLVDALTIGREFHGKEKLSA